MKKKKKTKIMIILIQLFSEIYTKTNVKEPAFLKQRYWFAGMGCVIKL